MHGTGRDRVHGGKKKKTAGLIQWLVPGDYSNKARICACMAALPLRFSRALASASAQHMRWRGHAPSGVTEESAALSTLGHAKRM